MADSLQQTCLFPDSDSHLQRQGNYLIISIDSSRRGYGRARGSRRVDARVEVLIATTALSLEATKLLTTAHALQSTPKVP